MCLHFTLKESSHLDRGYGVRRGKQDAMPAEQKLRLDAIGFVWDSLERAWEDSFAVLKKFKAREGHCRVPQDYTEGSFRLGSWVTNSALK